MCGIYYEINPVSYQLYIRLYTGNKHSLIRTGITDQKIFKYGAAITVNSYRKTINNSDVFQNMKEVRITRAVYVFQNQMDGVDDVSYN